MSLRNFGAARDCFGDFDPRQKCRFMVQNVASLVAHWSDMRSDIWKCRLVGRTSKQHREATFENVVSLVALRSDIVKRHFEMSPRWSHFEATLWSNISKCCLLGRTLKRHYPSEATFPHHFLSDICIWFGSYMLICFVVWAIQFLFWASRIFMTAE